MKQIFLLFLAGGMLAGSFAQDPAAPCCGVVKIEKVKNLVMIRDNTTGLLLQFKPSAADLRSIKIGDPVSASPQINNVTAINGIPKTYAILKPSYAAPCCGVVDLQMESAAPCCGMVSIKNNKTGKAYSISVPKEIMSTLKIGDKVFWETQDNMAVVQSSYGNASRTLNSFGYPATPETSLDNDKPGIGTNSMNSKMNEKTLLSETDKWVIMSAPGLKKGAAKLNLDFPPGVEWDMDIYTSQNKFLINRSSASNHKSYILAPGLYNLRLNTVVVENVPLEDQAETRLKAGIYPFTNGSWELRNESGSKFLTSGNKAKKMALPVGNYNLIKDKLKRQIVIGDGILGSAATSGNETLWWIVYEFGLSSAELATNFWGGNYQNDSLTLAWKIKIYDQAGEPLDILSSTIPSHAEMHSYPFQPGTYTIKINDAPINNVPLTEGSMTVLKAGYLFTRVGQWRLMDADKTPLTDFRYMNFDYNYDNILPVPPGSYILSYSPGGNNYSYYPLTIRDGDVIDITKFAKDNPPRESDSWIMEPVQSSPSSGLLDLDFPVRTQWKVEIFGRNQKLPIAKFSADQLRSKSHHPLPEGSYTIRLSNFPVEKVLIRNRYETRLKWGVLNIERQGQWSVVLTSSSATAFSGSTPGKVILPVGQYYFKYNGQNEFINIKDGETVDMR